MDHFLIICRNEVIGYLEFGQLFPLRLICKALRDLANQEIRGRIALTMGSMCKPVERTVNTYIHFDTPERSCGVDIKFRRGDISRITRITIMPFTIYSEAKWFTLRIPLVYSCRSMLIGKCRCTIGRNVYVSDCILEGTLITFYNYYPGNIAQYTYEGSYIGHFYNGADEGMFWE